MKDLITIVIPVYKVERYINRCVESVINQTYKNLEIILVDDGSPDNCPKICDNYSKKDKRIKVIHKENGGLSDARNVGIDMARGKYITFIDSDDWIPLDSIRLLYDCLIENDADIASGLIKEVFNEKSNDEIASVDFKLYNTESALQKLMYLHEFSNSASGKLYKKELFNDIKYPIGKYYEDLGTTYKVFAISNRIVSLNSVVYYYFQNNDSIMHKQYTSKRLEGIGFTIESLEFIKDKYPRILNSAIYRLYYECMSILNDMPYNSIDRLRVLSIIKKYKKIILKDRNLSKKQKMLCYFSIFGQSGIKLAFFIRNLLKKWK